MEKPPEPLTMRVDVLVVGQGVSGTFLALALQKVGLSCLVIDDGRPGSPSRVAAGLINPVTGKRSVTTWLAAELLPCAREAYGDAYLTERAIVSFFSTLETRAAFLDRFEEDPTYLRLPRDPHAWAPYFHDHYGHGLIQPAYVADLRGFLSAARASLPVLEETFSEDHLAVEPRAVRYKDLEAAHLIFCDGLESMHRCWFELLPFSPSKGEALLIEAPGLPPGPVFKKALTLVPLGESLYWAGSSYEWSYTDPYPSPAFRTRTEQTLKEWLQVPFRVVDHLASVRPTTVEQKPFVGLHPVHTSIGILGGMGTKGCSLAPYFAQQLAGLLAHGTPILPAADVRRFARILSR